MIKSICTTAFLLFLMAAQSQTSVGGKVLDENGNGVKDANISILGTLKGASTNTEGMYRIPKLQPKTYYINVSYLGYAPQTKTVTLTEGENELNFTLNAMSNELEEVIVSGANRRLENLQKTATSVSAVSTQEISQLQIKQIGDLNSIAPNFRSYDDGATGAFSMIASRGITTIDNKPVVGVYIDDIPYFDGFAFPIALQDLESIEVLRGPQGTLYGRNSLAGVVRINTKKPTNNVNGYVTTGYGNLDAKEFSFAFNAPLVKDKLFLRATSNILDRDGYVKNSFNIKDLQNRKIADANIRLKYLATDNLRFTLQYNVQRKEANGYVFAVASPTTSLEDIIKNNPYKANFNLDVLGKVVSQNTALSVKYDFPSFSISSVTAYQKTTADNLDEYDYTPLDAQYGRTNNILDNFSEELRFTSTNDSPLQWTTGVLLYHNKSTTDRDLVAGKDITMISPTAFPNVRTDILENIQKGLAVYGQASYDINEKLSATGGMRFDYDENSVDVRRSFNVTALPASNFAETATFNSFSPKATLGYDVNDNIFTYASVARGYRPGGVNQFVAKKEKAKFDEEKSWNYELGVKTTTLNNRLKLNLTGFYTIYKDQQIYTLLDLATFAFGTDNIGESRIYGVELESKASITKGLSAGLNLGYLDTKITKYTEVIVNPTTGAVTNVGRAGNRLPVSPKFNGNINLNYIQPISKKMNLESSADYNYQSDIYYDLQNEALQPSYGVLNGRLGITTKNIDVFIWGKNLTDEAYFGYGYAVGAFKAATFALPRTYGANVTLKF